MSNLPVVASIEELQDSNTDNRQRLQKSLRAGLLNVVKSVRSLETTMVNIARAQMEQQQLASFAQLEAAREAARKDQDQKKRAETADAATLDLGGIAMPALVAIAASITGLDAALKALRLPNTFKNISKVLTTVSDAVKSATKSLVSVADKIKNIKWMDLVPKVTFPDNAAFLERINTRAASLRTALVSQITETTTALKTTFLEFTKTVTTKAENLKATILSPITKAIDNLKLTISNIKFPELPKLAWPKAVTDLKLPTVEMPEALKNFKFPEMPNFTEVMDRVKLVLRGADGTGGILGFFSNIGGFLTDIPGLKTAFRLVGGPVTAALLGIIDFFTGFYKGFVGGEDKFDEFGNKIEDDRSFVTKFLEGLEGGFLGFTKGITEAIDLLFIKLPAWLLEKIGLEDAGEFLRGFSLTALVDPIWNGIKSIFTFFSDPEFRAEQVAKFKDSFIQMFENAVENIKSFFSDLLEKVNPKNWFGGGEEELTAQQQARQVLEAEMVQAANDQNMEAMNNINAQLAALDEIGTRQMRGRAIFTRDLDGDGRISTNERFTDLQKALEATIPTEGGEVLARSAEQAGTPAQVDVSVGGTAVDASTTLNQSSSSTVAVPPSASPNREKKTGWGWW